MAPGKYLYSIVRCSQEHAFPGISPIGDPRGQVHTIPYDGLAVVVSDSPTPDYEASRENLLAHQRVLEGVMRQFPLLPVRFGTVTSSPSPVQDLHRLLHRRFLEFDRLLDDMEGKVELGLKAFWRDESVVYAEIVAENREIGRLVRHLAGKPPQATHFDRARLGEMVKKALDHKKAEEAAQILRPLRQLAYQVRDHPVLADRMVVTAAFLVERGQEPEFDQAVREIDARLSSRVALKYVGPVPPYNFVNIVVNWEELR